MFSGSRVRPMWTHGRCPEGYPRRRGARKRAAAGCRGPFPALPEDPHVLPGSSPRFPVLSGVFRVSGGSAGEGRDSFRGAPAGRAVVARLRGAQIAGAAAAVAAGGDVVEGRGAGRRVGEGRRVGAAGGGAAEGVHTGDDRRGRARATEGVPAGRDPVGVVDRDAGGRVGDGRDIGDGPLRAARVRLPGRLRVVGGAAGAGALGAAGLPDALGPAAAVGAGGQGGTADGGHVVGGCRVLGAVAGVTRGDGDGDAGVVEVRGVVGGVGGGLRAAVAVGDVLRAQGDGLVHRLAEVGHGGGGGLDEQD